MITSTRYHESDLVYELGGEKNSPRWTAAAHRRRDDEPLRVGSDGDGHQEQPRHASHGLRADRKNHDVTPVGTQIS